MRKHTIGIISLVHLHMQCATATSGRNRSTYGQSIYYREEPTLKDTVLEEQICTETLSLFWMTFDFNNPTTAHMTKSAIHLARRRCGNLMSSDPKQAAGVSLAGLRFRRPFPSKIPHAEFSTAARSVQICYATPELRQSPEMQTCHAHFIPMPQRADPERNEQAIHSRSGSLFFCAAFLAHKALQIRSQGV